MQGIKTINPKLFTLKKGELTQFGYSLKDSKVTDRERKKALVSAYLSGMTSLSLIRKLFALKVLNKYQNPAYVEKLTKDIDFMNKIRKEEFKQGFYL